MYQFISCSTTAKKNINIYIYVYIHTSQHLTSRDFHITTSLSFLPQDPSLKHPQVPPVRGLKHRQRQKNATSRGPEDYLCDAPGYKLICG